MSCHALSIQAWFHFSHQGCKVFVTAKTQYWLQATCRHSLRLTPTHLRFVTLAPPRFQLRHVSPWTKQKHASTAEDVTKTVRSYRIHEDETNAPGGVHIFYLISVWKAGGDRSLFVCQRRCFCCVCDTTQPPSPPPRLLIPPVEMKCNGADSIRALPPRETRRIKSRRNPPEPFRHSLLQHKWEGNKTIVANSLGSFSAQTAAMEGDAANVEGQRSCWRTSCTHHAFKEVS